MKYVEYINGLLKSQLRERKDPIVVYGQNVGTGSCISGLAKGIEVASPSEVINTTNAENTAVGMGFGLMFSGVSSLFIVKQLDFLLLSIDQMVNTHNYARRIKPTAAFTVMPVVVDSGYDGLQSSLNTLPDYSSIACIPTYAVTNKHDAQYLLENELLRPGFRMMAISQRLYRTELIEFSGEVIPGPWGSWFKYQEGQDLTIVCFNFSLPQGKEFAEKLESKGKSATLFSVNNIPHMDWTPLLEDAKRTGCLLIVDDTKSLRSSSTELEIVALRELPPKNVRKEKRLFSEEWFVPISDTFELEQEGLLSWIGVS